jgi:hypothetical protein
MRVPSASAATWLSNAAPDGSRVVTPGRRSTIALT